MKPYDPVSTHEQTRVIATLAAVADDVGYFGAAIIGLSYFLNQRGLLASEDWRFPAINLAGSLLIVTSLWFHPNTPSVVIEVFWSSISLYGVQRNLRLRRHGLPFSRRLPR